MKKIGVIVGRFQVPDLHAGHRSLIEFVREYSDEVLVVLGSTHALSGRHPFTKKEREQVIRRHYPGLKITEVRDEPSDKQWSENLDALIRQTYPKDRITL